MLHFHAVACQRVHACELAEAPRWDPVRGELIWTDLLAGQLVRGEIHDGSVREIDRIMTDQQLGAAAPLKDGSGWVVAAGRGISLLRRDGELEPLVALEPEDATDVRMNDGACDPRGRFWAGSMSPTGCRDGALYCFEAPVARCVLSDVGLANGLGWSPDSKIMYFVDSARRIVHRFPFDPESAALGDPDELITVDPADGIPDGIAIDASGDIWVAIWGGWCVRHHSPDGELIDVVALPVAQPSSCCFVDHLLIITTARLGLSKSELQRQPEAGRLFSVRVEAEGLPVNQFSADGLRQDRAWLDRTTRRAGSNSRTGAG